MLAVLFVLLSFSLSFAEKLTVGPGGQYKTIQQAVGKAKCGDVLLLRNGVYNERVVIKNLNCPDNNLLHLTRDDGHTPVLTSDAGGVDAGVINIQTSGVNVHNLIFDGNALGPKQRNPLRVIWADGRTQKLQFVYITNNTIKDWGLTNTADHPFLIISLTGSEKQKGIVSHSKVLHNRLEQVRCAECIKVNHGHDNEVAHNLWLQPLAGYRGLFKGQPTVKPTFIKASDEQGRNNKYHHNAMAAPVETVDQIRKALNLPNHQNMSWNAYYCDTGPTDSHWYQNYAVYNRNAGDVAQSCFQIEARCWGHRVYKNFCKGWPIGLQFTNIQSPNTDQRVQRAWQNILLDFGSQRLKQQPAGIQIATHTLYAQNNLLISKLSPQISAVDLAPVNPPPGYFTNYNTYVYADAFLDIKKNKLSFLQWKQFCKGCDTHSFLTTQYPLRGGEDYNFLPNAAGIDSGTEQIAQQQIAYTGKAPERGIELIVFKTAKRLSETLVEVTFDNVHDPIHMCDVNKFNSGFAKIDKIEIQKDNRILLHTRSVSITADYGACGAIFAGTPPLHVTAWTQPFTISLDKRDAEQ